MKRIVECRQRRVPPEFHAALPQRAQRHGIGDATAGAREAQEKLAGVTIVPRK